MSYGNAVLRIPFDLGDGNKSVQEFVNDGIASYLIAESPAGERAILAQIKGENNGTQSINVRLSSLANVTVLDADGNQVYPAP